MDALKVEFDIPSAFIWSRIRAESAEKLEGILRRKELERRIGDELFCWGIGQSLGQSAAVLRVLQSHPKALFSPMLSRPRPADASPPCLLVWTAYESDEGSLIPLPEHVLITSRGAHENVAKARNYALLCRSSTPLGLGPIGSVSPSRMRNLATGNPLGSSQLTTVVSHSPALSGGQEYTVAFHADWIACLRLAAPVPAPVALAQQMEQISRGAGPSEWKRFVRDLRQACDDRVDRSGSLAAQASLFP